MNPLQSALLSETEFLVTFENCHEFPYLLNVTRFSYITMKCKYDANLLENVPTALVGNVQQFFYISCRGCSCSGANDKNDGGGI